MRYHLTSVAALALATACAGATAGPMFEFAPSSGPLTYEVHVSIDVSVETPMGSQTMETDTDATVTFEIGERVGDAWQVVVRYDALESTTSGGTGREIVSGEGVLGKPFVGTLDRNGVVEITDVPDMPDNLENALDPATMFSQLLPPLPPRDHQMTEPWPVATSQTTQAGLEILTGFEGTGRIERDTVWNGISAQVLVATGEIEADGHGTPPGAPGELSIALAGQTEQLYVWDPIRGVMLASFATTETEGTMSMMGMDMPATMTVEQRVSMRR